MPGAGRVETEREARHRDEVYAAYRDKQLKGELYQCDGCGKELYEKEGMNFYDSYFCYNCWEDEQR